MKQLNNLYKPDSTIMVVKGFPLKGSYVLSDVKDLTIDMKDSNQDEDNG